MTSSITTLDCGVLVNNFLYLQTFEYFTCIRRFLI